MKPCIGLVVPSLEQGGGVSSVAEFVYQVIQQSGKYNVVLISLSTSSVDDVGVAITRPSSWFRIVWIRNGLWRGRHIMRVGAFASEFEFQRYKSRKALAHAIENCDVIQVVAGSPAWANCVVGLGKPIALQVATLARIERRRRDANPEGFVGWWRKVMTVITDWLDNRALKKVDSIQLINNWMLEYSYKINSSRSNVDIRYAPPGVDSSLFLPLPSRLSLDSFYILCVGRLDDPRKNINLLLKAFSLLPIRLSSVQLVTAGSSPPPDNYWAQVDALGLRKRVRHVSGPNINELIELYQHATVFALPSDEEGLGLVILESMSCAVPVVSTKCGGPEGIISDGKDGFLVPLDDAECMAERLAVLCTDRKFNIQMGLEARKTIEARYTNEVTGKVYIDMWDRLINNSKL